MEAEAEVVQFQNAWILRDHKLIKDDLWTQNGKIIDPQRRFYLERKIEKVGFNYVVDSKIRSVDCSGMIISPGFIDLQINGAFGVDFSTPSDNIEEGVNTVAKGLLQHGVTAFLPTLITSQPEVYRKIIPRIKPTVGNKRAAQVIGMDYVLQVLILVDKGLHLEGPFINVLKYGAHQKQFVRSSCEGIKTFEEVYGTLDNVKIITVAPELDGMTEVIPELRRRNIVVSAGHSMASFEQATKAVDLGVTLITHLFNAMIPFHHRDPGLVGLLGTINRQVFYGMILDGIHSHPASVKVAYKSHPDGIVLTTDAIEAMGLQPGRYQLGTMTVDISNNRAYIAGTDTLAGSIATMDSMVRQFQASTGCSTVEALEAATLHPAKVLGLQHQKGTLNFGSDADFVILDQNLVPQATYLGGNLAWSRDSKQQAS